MNHAQELSHCYQTNYLQLLLVHEYVKKAIIARLKTKVFSLENFWLWNKILGPIPWDIWFIVVFKAGVWKDEFGVMCPDIYG